MLNLRRMDNVERDGFAGAENFPDGTEPLIGTFKVGSEEWCLVVSGNKEDMVQLFDEDDNFFLVMNPINVLYLLQPEMPEADFQQLFETGQIV